MWAKLFGAPDPNNLRRLQAMDAFGRSTFSLVDAYRDVPNVHLGTLVHHMASTRETWFLKHAAPMRDAGNSMGFELEVIEFGRYFAGITPPEGVSRIMEQRSRKTGATMSRRGLAIQLEAEWARSRKGILNFREQLIQLVNNFVQTSHFQVLQAFIDCNNEYNMWEMTHGRHDPVKVSKSMDDEVYQWCIGAKKNGLEELDTYVTKTMHGFGNANMWILPGDVSDYVNSRPEKTDYWIAGQAGPDRVNSIIPTVTDPINFTPTGDKRDTTEPISWLNNRNKVFLSRPLYTDTDGEVDLLVTRSQIGEYNYLPLPRDTSDFCSRHRSIMIYDEDNDNDAEITQQDILNTACPHFEGDTELYNMSLGDIDEGKPLNAGPFSNAREMQNIWCYRSDGVPHRLWGQVAEEHMPHDDMIRVGETFVTSAARNREAVPGETTFTNFRAAYARAMAFLRALNRDQWYQPGWDASVGALAAGENAYSPINTVLADMTATPHRIVNMTPSEALRGPVPVSQKLSPGFWARHSVRVRALARGDVPQTPYMRWAGGPTIASLTQLSSSHDPNDSDLPAEARNALAVINSLVSAANRSFPGTIGLSREAWRQGAESQTKNQAMLDTMLGTAVGTFVAHVTVGDGGGAADDGAVARAAGTLPGFGRGVAQMMAFFDGSSGRSMGVGRQAAFLVIFRGVLSRIPPAKRGQFDPDDVDSPFAREIIRAQLVQRLQGVIEAGTTAEVEARVGELSDAFAMALRRTMQTPGISGNFITDLTDLNMRWPRIERDIKGIAKIPVATSPVGAGRHIHINHLVATDLVWPSTQSRKEGVVVRAGAGGFYVLLPADPSNQNSIDMEALRTMDLDRVMEPPGPVPEEDGEDYIPHHRRTAAEVTSSRKTRVGRFLSGLGGYLGGMARMFGAGVRGGGSHADPESALSHAFTAHGARSAGGAASRPSTGTGAGTFGASLRSVADSFSSTHAMSGGTDGLPRHKAPHVHDPTNVVRYQSEVNLLARLERASRSRDSPDELGRDLFYGTPINRLTMQAMDGSDVLIPVWWFIFRPWATYDMHMGIKTMDSAGLGDDATANYWVGDKHAQIGAKVQTKVVVIHVTIWSRAWVARPKNVFKAYNIKPKARHGGLGIEVINCERFDPATHDGMKHGSIITTMLPYSTKIGSFRSRIDLLGHLYKNLVRNLIPTGEGEDSPIHYNTAPMIVQRFGLAPIYRTQEFKRPPFVQEGSLISNTLMYLGDTLFFNPKTGRHDIYVPGQGHWKGRSGRGWKAFREGKNSLGPDIPFERNIRVQG